MGSKGLLVPIGQGRKQQGDTNAQSPVYRNELSKDGWPTLNGVITLYELFESSVSKFSNNKCLGWRPIENGHAGDYKWHTYKETQGLANDLASALIHIGLGAKSKVGVYAANCMEWMVIIQAVNRMSAVLVPLYDSLGESAVEYTVNHSETELIFVEASKFAPLKKALPKIKQNVKHIIYWGDAKQSDIDEIKSQGLEVTRDVEFLQMGSKNPAQNMQRPTAQDTACIMYTSGTTGNPKGVVLSHNNILGTIIAMQQYVKQAKISYSDNESMLSYLTLAHIFGRCVEEFALSLGGAIGYWQIWRDWDERSYGLRPRWPNLGDVKKLTDDVACLKPTLFFAVPRVLERIQSGIVAKIKKKNWVVRFIFNIAYKFKIGRIKHGRSVPEATPFLDKYFFKTFKQAFGGNVRFIVSGGAPLATHVEDFISVTLCCPVFQGYGLTETCGASFVAQPKSGHSGTVGPVLTSLELKLEGSEELGYDPLGTPPRGEILVRGPALFKGYYKDEEKTSEAIDSDGWFHSGDVGELTELGCLKVIDRIKNMFKLAQGEYIAAEKLEQAYSSCGLVEQIWIYGNSYESTLVALVVPDHKEFKSFASNNGGSGSIEEMCNNKQVAAALCDELNKTGKKENLRGFERIKMVHLDPTQWDVDNGFMTPSFKLKRPQLQKHYQKEIDNMYAEIKKGGN